MKAALIKLHIAVFLWGFTGVLGKTIDLNEGLLVWYRLLITVVSLFILMKWKNEIDKISFSMILRLTAIGSIVALHWVFFYGSIKYANVSIALICLSSAGLLTSLLEPLILGRKVIISEVLLGSIALAGIYLIFHFDIKFRTGIIIGVLSALFSVIFSILNKKTVAKTAPKTMMLYELGGGFIILTSLMPMYLKFFPTEKLIPTDKDFGWLLLLSWVCTILAMDLSLQALKKISAFTQNLTLNLEPVYGIILAFVIYKENKDLSNTFYIGFTLIFIAVIIQMLRVVKFKKH
jgi:drug/metabolite transporter (DMT)-like permease